MFEIARCPAHVNTPLLEEAGGKEYCPRCVQSEIDPTESFQLLARLAATSRVFHDNDTGFDEWELTLEETEDYIDTITRGPRG